MSPLKIIALGLFMAGLTMSCEKENDVSVNPAVAPTSEPQYPQYTLKGQEVEIWHQTIPNEDNLEIKTTVTHLNVGQIVEENGSVHEGEVTILNFGEDLPEKITVGEKLFIGRVNPHEIPQATFQPRLPPIVWAILICSAGSVEAYDQCVRDQSPAGVIIEFGCGNVQDQYFEDCINGL